jgi:molecular chaperone DnaK
MATQNRTLGRFDLYGIPPAARGIPQIEVTFDIDADGIMHVSAKDMGTGKEQKIRITASSGLSKDEVDKMIKDAEEHAAEDRVQKELIDIRNQADSVIHSVERTLKDYGEKISFEDRSEIGKKIDDLKAKKEGNNVAEIKQSLDDLQQSVYKLSEAVYKEAAQAQQPGGQQQGPEQPPPQDEAPGGAEGSESQGDADYRVVDDESDKNG